MLQQGFITRGLLEGSVRVDQVCIWIRDLWSVVGQCDSAQVEARCAPSSWT